MQEGNAVERMEVSRRLLVGGGGGWCRRIPFQPTASMATMPTCKRVLQRTDSSLRDPPSYWLDSGYELASAIQTAMTLPKISASSKRAMTGANTANTDFPVSRSDATDTAFT